MRTLIIALTLVSSVAHADDAITETDDDVEIEMPDQSVGAAVGFAGGGYATPGGLRVAGHYLYQLSASDWFDGTASFTFGGATDCGGDRMCDHGFVDGRGVEIVAGVRRYFAAQGMYRPFARAGVGVSIVHFPGDDVTGIAIPLHLGGGVRAAVSKHVAVVGLAELVAGLGRFDHALGTEPQLGLAVTAAAEFRLP